MSEIRDELALLEAHYDTTFDLGTPRQYTQHGGWNQSCACGHGLGDAGGDNGEERVAAAHRAHLAEALAAYVAGKQAEALREAALAFEKPHPFARPLTKDEVASILRKSANSFEADWIEWGGRMTENDATVSVGSAALLTALYDTYVEHIGMVEPDGPDGPYMWCACGWRSDDLGSETPGLSYAVHLTNAQHAAAVKALQPLVTRVIPPERTDATTEGGKG